MGKMLCVFIFLTSLFYSIGYYIHKKMDINDFWYDMLIKIQKIKKREEEKIKNNKDDYKIASSIETDSDSELDIVVEDNYTFK